MGGILFPEEVMCSDDCGRMKLPHHLNFPPYSFASKRRVSLHPSLINPS